jgi:hypothetical protein
MVTLNLRSRLFWLECLRCGGSLRVDYWAYLAVSLIQKAVPWQRTGRKTPSKSPEGWGSSDPYYPGPLGTNLSGGG